MEKVGQVPQPGARFISEEDCEDALRCEWNAAVSAAWKRVAEMAAEGIDVVAWARQIPTRDIERDVREARRLLQLDGAVDPPPVVVTPDAINELKRLKPHVEKWKTADGREVRSRLANDLLTVIDARISALSEASGSGPERRADTQHQSTDDTVPCPACSGEGRAISDETCDECGGRGEVARAAEIAYQLGRLISHDNTPREHAALNAAIAHFELVGSHGTTPGIDARGSATDPSIEPSAEIDEARQLLLYRIRRSCAVPQDVDALIAAVLRSRDRQQEEERTDQARFDQSDQSTADLRGDDRDDTKP